MGSLKWFLRKKMITLEEPNKELALSYIEKAETDLAQMRKAVSKNWEVEAAYYSIYHSAYSILVRIGIKCEKHDATFAVMKDLLGEYFTKEEVKFISKAHDARNDLQYYVNREVSQEMLSKILAQPIDWITKCKSILSTITEKEINEILGKIKEIA